MNVTEPKNQNQKTPNLKLSRLLYPKDEIEYTILLCFLKKKEHNITEMLFWINEYMESYGIVETWCFTLFIVLLLYTHDDDIQMFQHYFEKFNELDREQIFTMSEENKNIYFVNKPRDMLLDVLKTLRMKTHKINMSTFYMFYYFKYNEDNFNQVTLFDKHTSLQKDTSNTTSTSLLSTSTSTSTSNVILSIQRVHFSNLFYYLKHHGGEKMYGIIKKKFNLHLNPRESIESNTWKQLETTIHRFISLHCDNSHCMWDLLCLNRMYCFITSNYDNKFFHRLKGKKYIDISKDIYNDIHKEVDTYLFQSDFNLKLKPKVKQTTNDKKSIVCVRLNRDERKQWLLFNEVTYYQKHPYDILNRYRVYEVNQEVYQYPTRRYYYENNSEVKREYIYSWQYHCREVYIWKIRWNEYTKNKLIYWNHDQRCIVYKNDDIIEEFNEKWAYDPEESHHDKKQSMFYHDK